VTTPFGGQDHPEPGAARAEQDAAVARFQTAIRDSTRLTRLFTILSDPASLETLVDRVVLLLSELFAADVVVLLRTVPGMPPRTLGSIGLPEDPALPPFACAGDAPSAIAIRDRAPVVVADARADSRLDAPLRALDVDAAVLLPVLGSREVLGVLVLARCAPTPFSQPDVELLAAMALRIGLVLARARAEEVRQQLEAGVRQAQKAESLGRMAGAVAHRFNNMLAAATGHLEVAVADLPPGHEAAAEIAQALASLREASHLSSLLRAYLGQGNRGRQPLDLVALCRESLQALRASVLGPVRLRTALPDGPLTVVGDAAGLEGILANLVVNAREAIAGEGEIVVSLRAVPAAEVAATQVPSPGWRPEAAAYACLEVADTGCGIAAEARENLFDPFFTTKAAGLGLGLPVAWGTVRAHQGAIGVESEAGRGSRFRVFLPLAPDAPPRAGAPQRPAPAPVAPGGLVLVVDDEPQVLRASRRLLQKLGYQVATAADGVEALEVFGARAAEVRFVLLDLSMPRMDGWQTLAALRAVRPGIPVVLASGYDQAHVMGGKLPAQPPTFLSKPFSRAELEAAIAEALAAADRGAG
jgi:signal transduction histidine kinase/CheY-like chemotaxis protein